MRLEIYVRPSASVTTVGGSYDGALVVRVTEPADAGRATRAALRAVADAVGVRPSAVSLVRGAAARRKLIEIDVGSRASEAVTQALRRLIEEPEAGSS